MVNISKRMRVLKPLLSLRHGPGAAVLPQYQTQPETTPSPSSQPTLLRIRLDFPPGIGPASKGARAFWRNHLRRLKYHNPALPITVNQNAKQGTEGNPGPAWRLFLDFEGEEKVLRELATEPKNEEFKQLMEAELRPRPRVALEGDTAGGKSQSRSRSAQTTPIPPPSSSPDQLTPLTSSRTISLPILNRPAGALWFWFQQRTKCIDVPESNADRQLAQELAEEAVKGEEDRQRVKKRIDQIKAREEMLKLARREVDRMKAEQ